MGLLDLWGAQTENNKIKKFMPTVGFEPGTLCIRSERAKRWAIGANEYRSPKGERLLPECAIKSYLYHLVDVVKYFVV